MEWNNIERKIQNFWKLPKEIAKWSKKWVTKTYVHKNKIDCAENSKARGYLNLKADSRLEWPNNFDMF